MQGVAHVPVLLATLAVPLDSGSVARAAFASYARVGVVGLDPVVPAAWAVEKLLFHWEDFAGSLQWSKIL